jgi:hypothetical protein
MGCSCTHFLSKKSKIKIPIVRSGDRCGHNLQQIMWSQRNPYIISHAEHIFFSQIPNKDMEIGIILLWTSVRTKLSKGMFVCTLTGEGVISWRRLRYSCAGDVTVPQCPLFLWIQFSAYIKANNKYWNRGYDTIRLYCESLQCYQPNWNSFSLREQVNSKLQPAVSWPNYVTPAILDPHYMLLLTQAFHENPFLDRITSHLQF